MKSHNWDDLRFLLAALDSGTLSAAARRLNTSIATVSRRIEALEAALGLALLQRTPSGVVATPAGSRIQRLAAGAAEQLEQLNRVAAQLRQDPEEPVRITSTEPVISEILAPRLPALQHGTAFPLQLSVQTANVSLARHEAELAIRLDRPVGASLVTRRLEEINMGLHASAAFTAAHGTALTAATPLLGIDNSFGSIPETRWVQAHGLEDSLLLRSSSVRTLLNAARAGLGAALIPDFLAAAEGLVPLTAPPVPARKPYLVFHRDLRRLPRIVHIRKWIVDCFAQACG